VEQLITVFAAEKAVLVIN